MASGAKRPKGNEAGVSGWPPLKGSGAITRVCLAHTIDHGEVRQRKANFIFSQKVKITWHGRSSLATEDADSSQVAALTYLQHISAAFSPIMIDVALVLPDVSVGMIERCRLAQQRAIREHRGIKLLRGKTLPTDWDGVWQLTNK